MKCLRKFKWVKDGYSVKCLEKRLEPVLQKFWEGQPRLKYPYFDTVIVFRHVYAVKRPGWERCVPADGEVDCVIRLVFQNALRQICPVDFRHYHCCALGEEECTEVYVMPASDLGKWLFQETSMMEILPKGGKLYECPTDARKAQNDRMGKV